MKLMSINYFSKPFNPETDLMSCLWRKLADNSLAGRQNFHLVLLYLLNFRRTGHYRLLKEFRISNLRSHTTAMNLATECIRLTREAEN